MNFQMFLRTFSGSEFSTVFASKWFLMELL